MTPRTLALATSVIFLGGCGGGGSDNAQGMSTPVATTSASPAVPATTPTPTTTTTPTPATTTTTPTPATTPVEPTTTVPAQPATPPAPSAQPPYALSQDPVSVKFVAGYPAKVTLVARQTTPFVGIAYIKVTPDNGVIESVTAKPNSDGSFNVTLLPSATAKAGDYAGQITVNICKDAACASPIEGAPFKVPYAIEIIPVEGSTKTANLTALAHLAGAADWTTWQGSAAHTGFVPVSLTPAKFSVRWKRENAAVNGNQMLMSLVVSSGGLLYFSTSHYADGSRQSANLYAISEHDGKQAWVQNFATVPQGSYTNAPTVAGGKVYAVIGAQEWTAMHGFDAFSGQELFSTPMRAQWTAYYAPVVVDGTLYSEGGWLNGMYAFNANTGTQQWSMELMGNDGWAPAVDTDNTYVFESDSLIVTNRRTGARVSRITGTYGLGTSSPILGAPGHVIAATLEALMNFDTTKQSLRWSVKGMFIEGAAYDNKEIYVLRYPIALEVRNESDGSTSWSWTPPSSDTNWYRNVVLTKNLVFVSTKAATYAIDRTSHQTVWSYPMGGVLALSANGILYIHTQTSMVAINVN